MVLLPGLLESLQLVRQVEHLEQLLAPPVCDPGERPSLEAVRDRDHGLGRDPTRGYLTSRHLGFIL